MRAPTAFRCNRLIWYELTHNWAEVSWSTRSDVEVAVYRGRCTVEPKGHDGPCAVNGWPEVADVAPTSVGGTDD